MTDLDVLLLSDGKPGHYHLSDGVVLALERLGPVRLHRLDIKRRWLMPGRVLSRMVANNVSPRTILKLGYGTRAAHLPKTRLVISAGGNTLAANIAASQLYGAQNIFLGSLRRFAPEKFSLVITSFSRFKNLPRHIVALKPNVMDPDNLGRAERPSLLGKNHPPLLAGLLLGGDSGQFKYNKAEWRALLRFINSQFEARGTRWVVSTSRRSGREAAKAVEDLRQNSNAVKAFIDYRTDGPGTLNEMFRSVDMVIVTEDSSSMVSEAVSARLPVVGVTPEKYEFLPHELEYRQYMERNNWTRSIRISQLDLDSFAAALSEIEPMKYNHVDVLAQRLNEHLPDLWK